MENTVYNNPALEDMIEVISQIPLSVFHTWQVINFFTNDENYAMLPDDVLKKTLNVSYSQLYRRIRRTLSFTVNNKHLLYLVKVKPSGIEKGNIKYSFGDKIDVDKNGKITNRNKLENNQYGYLVNTLKETINC